MKFIESSCGVANVLRGEGASYLAPTLNENKYVPIDGRLDGGPKV